MPIVDIFSRFHAPHRARRRGLMRAPMVSGVKVAALLAGLLAACGGPAGPANQISSSAIKAESPLPRVTPMSLDLSGFRENPPRRDEAVVVALLLPIGDARDNIRALAGDLYNSAQLALFDGGGAHIILKLLDTKGTPEGAQQAAMAAVAGEADMVIGPLFSASVKAVAPVLAGRDIPVLALSNDSSAAREHVWLMGFLPEQNITQIVAEAISQGLTRFGALLPEGPFGRRIGDSFVAEVERFGGTVVQVEAYPPDAKQMFEPVKKLAQFDRRTAAHQAEMARLTQAARTLAPEDMPVDAQADRLFRAVAARAPELVSAYEALKLTETLGDIPYDAVFLPEGGLALRNLAPLLPYYDIDPRRVKFIGTALWDDASLRQEPPLHGGWYAAPTRQGWRGFQTRYERVYRRAPPRLAAVSYDAMSLAIKLASIHDDNPFDRDYLTDANGFAGIDGIVRLRANGLNERGLAVLELTARDPEAVRRAPVSFVAYDRHMRAALALADRLKQENPDRRLSVFEGLDQVFMPEAAADNLNPTPTGPVNNAPSSDTGATPVNPSRPADNLEAVTPRASNTQAPNAEAVSAQNALQQ